MKKLKNFINKHYKFTITMIFILSIILRVIFINSESGDYKEYLSKWISEINENGGLYALKNNIGNYNVPYILILCVLTYLPINPLYAIKAVSFIFDYLTIIPVYLIINRYLKNEKKSFLISMLVTVLPTVVINSAWWAQCDIIYAFFALMAIYFFIVNKNIRAFLMYAVAISFKLQAIFILPAIGILYLKNKKIKWYYFLIIPIVYIIFISPALLTGRSMQDTISIYPSQVAENEIITCLMPNVHMLFDINYKLQFTLGITITFLIFLGLLFVILNSKIELKEKNIIELSLFCIMISNLLLPKMHERYMFLADILSIIYFVVAKKDIKEKIIMYLPLVVNYVSLFGYIMYITDTHIIKFKIASIIFLFFTEIFGIYIYKKYKNLDNINKKLT